MTQVSSQDSLPDFEILEKAASWFAHLQSSDVTQDDHQRFNTWLAESQAHQDAWRYVERVSQRFSILHKENQVDNASNTLTKLQQNKHGRRSVIRGIFLAAALGSTGLMSWQYTPLPLIARSWRADHRTGVGEYKEMVLADGSHIWLNTNSAINIDYNTQHRHITLVQGEILINTAMDRHQRPFFVSSQHGRMQALGTRFNVYQTAIDTELSVYDGRVAITTKTHQHTIGASEQATFDDTNEIQLSIVSSDKSAWTKGVIVADQMTLGELVTELSRYQHGYLGVSPDISTLPVVGSFPTTNLERALAMLSASLPVKVRSISPWWVSVLPTDP